MKIRDYGSVVKVLNAALADVGVDRLFAKNAWVELSHKRHVAFVSCVRHKLGTDPAKTRNALLEMHRSRMLDGCRPSRALIDVLTTIPITFNVRGVWTPPV